MSLKIKFKIGIDTSTWKNQVKTTLVYVGPVWKNRAKSILRSTNETNTGPPSIYVYVYFISLMTCRHVAVWRGGQFQYENKPRSRCAEVAHRFSIKVRRCCHRGGGAAAVFNTGLGAHIFGGAKRRIDSPTTNGKVRYNLIRGCFTRVEHCNCSGFTLPIKGKWF